MVIECKICGGTLKFTEDSTVCVCEYCGKTQTLPSADNEKKVNLFYRANRLRMKNEFDKAAAIYEQIAAEFPEEAEAYWGLCLCNYGIEYVDDPSTGEKKPTCHRTMTSPIMEDGNFEQACDYADTVARRVYRDEAKEIDRIQKEILSIAANEQPYDVFICYKETDENGDRTEDSVLAQDIHRALTADGLKVFFSRITLEDKLGVQYEPYIYAALSSAKVMLAVGTRFEYYDAVWVKNEWSRFLAMMRNDHTKVLIPCFRDLDAYDMPKEFKGLQAQDMGKLGWLQDLTRGVEKLCGKGAAMPQPAQKIEPVQQAMALNKVNAENMVKRAYLFLEDGDNAAAEEYINKALDMDAECAPAYAARILMQHGLKNETELPGLRTSIDTDVDWKKALRFADADRRRVYEQYAQTINDNELFDITEKKRLEEERRNDKGLQRLDAKLNRIRNERSELWRKKNEITAGYQAVSEEIQMFCRDLGSGTGAVGKLQKRELKRRTEPLLQKQAELKKKIDEMEETDKKFAAAIDRLQSDRSRAEQELEKNVRLALEKR